MLFSKTTISGALLLFLGFVISPHVPCRILTKTPRNAFLQISNVLSLILIAYTFLIAYSSNLIIISTSFYALNFLIQTDTKTKKHETRNIKQKIYELKKEIETQKKYFYTKNSKSFHLKKCRTLKKTKKEKIKKTFLKENLIRNKYTPCKICKP